MSDPRSVGRSSYWRSVFQQHVDSGLRIRQFCQENGISQSTFFAWRKKLNQATSLADDDRVHSSEGNHRGKRQVKPSTRDKNASLAPRPDDQPAVQSRTPFVAVKLSTASEPIEVVHPQGYVLRVPSRANLDCLAQLFQILDQHATK